MGAKLSPGQPLIVGNPIRTLACPLARLSRIHAKANPRAGKQLSDPAPLVVGKRIHRIHDHGLDTSGWAARRQWSMIGIRNASVLPDPVPVAITVGLPSRIRRTAAAW